MEQKRVKTDWAAISLTPKENAIVCLHTDKPHCVWYDSLQILGEALANKQLSVRRWAMAIPHQLCIIKPLSLPASSLEEAAKMIEFELPSLVPLAQDKLVYGCTEAAKQDNIVTLTVYILKRSTLDQQLEPYRTLGIEPKKIVVDTLALHTWFDSQPNPSKASIGAYIDLNKCITFSSVGQQPQDVEEIQWSAKDTNHTIAQATQQLEKLYAKCQTNLNGDPMTFYLGGSDRHVQLLKDKLKRSDMIGARQMTLVPNPTIRPMTSQKMPGNIDQYGYEYASTYGLHRLAVTDRYPYADLLPTDYLRRQREKTKLFNYGLLAILIALSLLFLWTSMATMNGRLTRISRQIEGEISPYAKIAEDVDTKRALITAIKQQTLRRGRLSLVLEDLDTYTRDTSITLSNLIYEVHPTECLISATGQADTIDAVLELPNRMQQSQLLAGIGWNYIGPQSNQSTDNHGVEFKLSCHIKD